VSQEILLAVVAATAALLGATLPQVVALLKSSFQRKHERRVFLRGKYEELVLILHESLGLLSSQLGQSQRQDRNKGEQDDIQVAAAAANHVYMLTLIYFPLLKSSAKCYLKATMALQNASSNADVLAAADEHGKAKADFYSKIEACADTYT